MIKEFLSLFKGAGKPFDSVLGAQVRNITVFSGETIPRTGLYGIIKHEKGCDKMLPAERRMWYVKGSIATKPIICGHDVLWKLLGEA